RRAWVRDRDPVDGAVVEHHGRGADRRPEARGRHHGGATVRERPELSVVLPVFNEAESLGPLWQGLGNGLPGITDSVEVIFVDDGSTDGSADILRRLAKEDSRIRLILFEANAGLSAAFYAGLQATRGRIVATMDSDLQSDPRDIGMLMTHLADADAVVG